MTKHNYKTEIIKYLGEIKGGGNFVTHHTAGFVFPGLQVKNVGELSYPITEAQAVALIQAAHKAPFGKGHDTILDEKVRKVWEIDTEQLTFNGTKWNAFLKTVLNKIKPGLGLEGYSISAHLYKLLIYENGGFFLPHKDSEKEKGMFGTLIIGLPSKHTGGEMIIRFDGEEQTISFEEDAGNFSIPYTAFYADCEHEIKPVTSGYRVCLVYNLVKNDANKHIQLTSRESTVSAIASLLKARNNTEQEVPDIILLGHQYTPENFSAKSLKLNDRAKADALFRAAAKAGHYAKLCLVTSFLTGSPEYSGYYGDDMDDDDDMEMDEVHDEDLRIEHWADDGLPALPDVAFEENDLIVSFALKEGEPIVKESTGFMGNYGPDIMHWYHYGAVMIWSKATHAELLLLQSDSTRLEWIDYYAKNLGSITKAEITLAENILKNHLGQPRKHHEKPRYNAIVDWMIGRKDETLFLTIDQERLQTYFTKIDVPHWVKLFEFLPTGTTTKILNRVTGNCTLSIIAQLLSIIRELAEHAKFNQVIAVQMKALPGYLSKATGDSKKRLALNSITVGNILYIEAKHPQNEKWVNDMATALTHNKERNYINDAVAPEAIAYAEKTRLAYRLLLASKQDLQQRADNQPQPPADWSRKMPLVTDNKKQWLLLKDFLASPVEHIFDYRKNQNERMELENAIQNVTIDLKMETIRKGSPHTLRITKTRAAYQKAMKAWNEDVALLEKVNNKMKELTN